MIDIFEMNNIEKNHILKYEDLKDNDYTSFNACIGKDKNDNDIKINFEKTSHVLVGGSSGSGKSVLMNCILKSLLSKYRQMRLCIIDIKQVEFLQYKNDERLVVPIITKVEKAYNVLNAFLDIMYKRYNLLASKEYKNIKEWNERESQKMFRQVIVIDELADVLLDNKLIKTQLQKLLQLGRAVGIHLLLATQAPNAKTIPTELKINITCRIALQVPNSQNSKIIIDTKGAETLKGNGDAIIKVNNIATNFQVALVD